MKEDKGFSLVELVIVVAIMAVMGGFFFLGFGLLSGQHARECANDLSAALSKEKNYALTRSAMIDCYMELVCESGAYYVRYYQPKNAIVRGSNIVRGEKDAEESDWVLAEEEKIGKSVTVRYHINEHDEEGIKIEEGKSLKFVFDRISGAYKMFLTSDGATIGVLTNSDGTIDGGTKVDCAKMKITIESSRVYEITIYGATGKHELTRTK